MPLECKQPKDVLLLIKVSFYQYVHLLYKGIILPIILYSQVFKQNLSHAWVLGPDTLGKLTLYDIFISV